MIEVKLYSRADCHLCDEAKAELQGLQREFPHRLSIIDVDKSPDLKQKYGLEVPVVEVGPYSLKAPISSQELQMTLAAAKDRAYHIQAVEAAVKHTRNEFGNTWSGADGFSLWVAKHYMAVLNLFVLLYVGLPFLAPLLMKTGVVGPASLIYRSYGMVCHQLAYRSFFLFGEQAVYPRGQAGVDGLLTYGQATGQGEGSTTDELFAARQFIGNDAIGYKVALCERDVAIYGSILLFGLLYVATGRRLPPLPWYLWILVGLVPVGLDGLSQLLSQPPFNLWAFRESTPFFRTLTGILFGFMTAWFGYPMVEESMAPTRKAMEEKLEQILRKA